MDSYGQGDMEKFTAMKFEIYQSPSPLFKAIVSNCSEDVKKFLKIPHMLYTRDDFKNTVLHIAVMFKSHAVLDCLLAANCPPLDTANCYGWTPLYTAVAFLGDAAAADKLLASGADVNARNRDAVTALHRAAARDAALCRRLLHLGADPDAGDRSGQTPLHYAVQHGRLDSLRALLGGGACPDPPDCRRHTPLHLAAVADSPYAVDMLRQLAAAGARLDAANWAGLTPLHRAVQRRRPAAAAVLCDLGADPDAPSAHRGATPLHLAHAVEAGVLLAKGARVDVPDANGDTVLHRALFLTSYQPLLQLLDGDGDVDKRDGEGYTPLCLLCRLFAIPGLHARNSDQAMLKLIGRGADIDLANSEGNAPMHYAATNHPGKVPALLYHNADCNTANDLGESPFLLALRHGSEAADLLLDYEADLDRVSGESLLAIAMRSRPDLVPELLARGARLFLFEPRDGLFAVDAPVFNAILDAVGYENMHVRDFDSLLDYALRYSDPVLFRHLVENERFAELLEDIYSLSTETWRHDTEFSLIKYAVKNFVPEKAHELIYVLLSRGYTPDYADAVAVYRTFGFGRVLDFVMEMDLLPRNLDSPPDLLPRIMFDVSRSVDEHIESFVAVLDAAGPGTVADGPRLLLRTLTSFFRNRRLSGIVRRLAEAKPNEKNGQEAEMFACEVPSLQELARDAIRDGICAGLEVPTYDGFRRNTLRFTKTIRDIVRFTRPLY